MRVPPPAVVAYIKELIPMLTMNYKDPQFKKPKATGKVFSASDWDEFQQWVKLKIKASKPSESLKGKTTKAKRNKRSQKPKNALTRKELYHQQLEHPLWLKKRNVILERDHHQCVLCGSEYNLQVHHTKYSNDKKAWEYPNSDLVTLCEKCHRKVHSNCKHQLHPKYQEIWYNINGFSDYEATEFGRLRLKDSKKRIQWAHLGTQEYYIDSDGKPRVDDGNETQFTHITNDKGLVVWISKEKLLKLLKI